MDGLECSEINKSKLERTLRIDSEFFKKEVVQTEVILSAISHRPLTEFVTVSDGNHAGISEKFIEEGIPYYRGQDAGTFFIENSMPICIDYNTFIAPVMLRSHLKKNDVLLSIVGTIGSLSLVYSDKEATCSCKLAILRPKTQNVAELLAIFLSTKYGQMQISRYTRGAVQKGLILEDMDQLIVPIFGEKFNQKIRHLVMDSHVKIKLANEMMEQARAQLTSFFDANLLQLKKSSIAVKGYTESYKQTSRLDAEYYQPKYDEYKRMVHKFKNGYSFIKNEFDQVIDKCDRTELEYSYVEIGDIETNSGVATFNIISTEQLPANAKIMTQIGDIIVSTVRPNRGAVAILDTDGLLVSSAFTVLRQKKKNCYKKEVLQTLLRTNLYRDWLLRYNVGTSYPVIKDEDVLNLPIPLFDYSTQIKIETKVQKAFVFRKQSKRLIKDAKQAVEMAIEQGEDIALEWLRCRENFI